MWTQTISMEQLNARACWKVEFFCQEVDEDPYAGFTLVPLGELIHQRRETVDPQTKADHIFNYLGLEQVQSLTGDLVGFAPKPGKAILSRSKVFVKGDILYGRLRPYLNKVYLASDDQVASGICSGEFYVLVPDPSVVLPNFLRAMLTSRHVQRHVRYRQTGSALPRLQLGELLSIQIPVPPLAIQAAYEEYIVAEDSRRRRLTAEVASIPQRVLDTITKALESGEHSPSPTAKAGVTAGQ